MSGRVLYYPLQSTPSGVDYAARKPKPIVYIHAAANVTQKKKQPLLPDPHTPNQDPIPSPPLPLSTVVKIISLFQKAYNALDRHPSDVTLLDSLATATKYLDRVLVSYEELSDESRVVVDLFLQVWEPKLLKLAELDVE